MPTHEEEPRFWRDWADHGSPSERSLIVMKSISGAIPPRLIQLARENSSSELAWQYPTVLEVVAALAEREYAILGGDVMHDVRGGQLDYYHGNVYCGNWYLDWKREAPWAEYVLESVAVTVRYIEAYVRRNGNDSWFVPNYTDEEGYVALHARKP
jgi:hypothetical protein